VGELGDRGLFDAWVAGDHHAGDELVRRHFPLVLRFFRSKVEGEAEDLAQRTLLICLQRRERLWETADFRAFLLGIARHVLLAQFRDCGRRPDEVSIAEMSIQELRTSPSRLLARDEDRDRVRAALQRLPLDLQIIVELHYWEGLSYRDIAVVLETAEGTVKSRLHRAKQRLKTELSTGDVALDISHASRRQPSG
jgi:RNA polymerase sigma factor (sigma-70 family)